MLDINTQGYPKWVSLALARGATLVGQGHAYLPGHGPVDYDKWTLESSGTSSPARFQRYKDDAYNEGIAINGGSFRWLREALTANHRLTHQAQAARVKTPILLFQAGNDNSVGSDGQERFCFAAPACSIIVIEGSKHAIWDEVDEIRQPYFEQIFKFFSPSL